MYLIYIIDNIHQLLNEIKKCLLLIIITKGGIYFYKFDT